MIAGRLKDRAPAGTFELPQNFFLRQRLKQGQIASRKNVRQYIAPENAQDVVANLPDPGERTHCVLRGDFVLCSIIPAILHARGATDNLRIASLGVSRGNTDILAGLLDSQVVKSLTLLTSHYFASVDKEDIFAHCKRELQDRRGARLVVCRVHAKVLLLSNGRDHFAIEGSANLRANDGVEQITVYNCPELSAFHAEWMDAIAAKAENSAS